MSDTVLLTGASSQLGVFLLPRLQAAHFRVVALSRQAPVACLDINERIRWQRPELSLGQNDVAGTVRASQVRHLVSCGPLELARVLIKEHEDLQRVIAFSTSSVFTKSESAHQAEEHHMSSIIEDENRLKRLCEERGVPLVLIRPTLIYGCGLDRNISLLARFGRRFGFIPIASNAAGLRQPVHADDLAAVAVNALLIEQPFPLESMACGGSTLSYRDMAGRIATACGGSVRTLAIQPGMLSAVVKAASVLSAFRGINSEMVRRQSKNMVFDDSLLREALAYAPRPFNPTADDFKIPVEARKLQLDA